MNNFSIIGVHWYNRKATLKECTEKLLSFFEKLKDHNPDFFEAWYEKGKSKNEALQNKVAFNYESIKKLFVKKGNDDVYPKTSYKTGVWNGAFDDEKIASLSVSLGSSESKYYTNFCVIELPCKGEQYEFYQNKNNQDSLVNLLQEHWKPEWIMIDNIKQLF